LIFHYCHHVLDTDTEMARFVVTRLIGDYHTGGETDAIFLSISVMRIFVYWSTERNAVTNPMTVVTADSPQMSP